MGENSSLDKLREYDKVIDAFYEPGGRRIIAIIDFFIHIEGLPKEIDGIPVLFRIGHNKR